MKLLMLALLIALPLQSFAADKPNKDAKEFEKNYIAQIDEANKALANFVNLPCKTDSKTLDDTFKNLQYETNLVVSLVSQIPDDQDPLVQAREIELGYGFADVADKMTNNKIESCQDELHPDTAPDTNTTSRK